MSGFDELDPHWDALKGRDAEEREAYLRALEDQELATTLRGLLAADEAADEEGFLPEANAPAPPRYPQPGERLGKYLLREEVGRGGMGIVYRAYDEGLDRDVALKLLHPLLLHSQGGRDQQAREARVLASLELPGVVPLYDFTDVGGWTALVSRFIDGPNLAEEIARYHRGHDSQWSGPGDILRTLLPVADGLARVHAEGVWHRDVKPGNILLDRDGRGWLGDFGLARDVRTGTHSIQGALKGSIPYMSPEQARRASLRPDHRSDIYSFGVVLFEALSGRLPHEADDDGSLLERIAEDPATRLDEVREDAPPALVAICHKALRRNPAARYASMDELAGDLRAHLGGRPVSARLPGAGERLRSALARRGGLLGAGAVALAALAVGWALGPGRAPATAVELRGDHATGAPLYLQRLAADGDRFSAPRALGRLPWEGRLEPGVVRFVVEPTGGPRQELTRTIISTGVAQLVELPRPDGAGPRAMVPIPPGRFLQGIPADEGAYPLRPDSLRAFEIDEREVTVAEFARFVRATGHRPPEWWAEVDTSGHGSRPVTGIGYTDARAYAEWVGMRLPTRLEWEHAARGRDGRGNPWGELGPAPHELACVRPDSARPRGATDDFAEFVATVCPVGSHPEDRSPYGMLDAFGSVAEWVDALPRSLLEGHSQLRPLARVAKGLSWRQRPMPDGLAVFMEFTATERTIVNFVGFRCARSADPLLPRP